MKEIQINIDGVEIKYLKSHPDDRGFFREIIRFNDPIFISKENEKSFAQWSHSKMAKDTVKAWHYHHLQIDWWYVAMGVFDVHLFDNREESKTYKSKMNFKLGDEDCEDTYQAVVKIPQGVLHGGKVLSDFAHLFYVTSKTYDPKDEGRFAFNSEFTGVNWGDENKLIVAPNDRKNFTPEYKRVFID